MCDGNKVCNNRSCICTCVYIQWNLSNQDTFRSTKCSFSLQTYMYMYLWNKDTSLIGRFSGVPKVALVYIPNLSLRRGHLYNQYTSTCLNGVLNREVPLYINGIMCWWRYNNANCFNLKKTRFCVQPCFTGYRNLVNTVEPVLTWLYNKVTSV